MKKSSLVCLNLGSGPIFAKGWQNIDWGLLPCLGKFGLNGWLCRMRIVEPGYGVKWPPVMLRDIRKKLPFADSSVDFIYCSHVLEHLDKEEAKKVLVECRRMLKKEGIMRIVLPDLDIIRKIANADEFNRVMQGYDRDQYVGILGKIKSLAIRPHRWMYNFESFKRLLREAGYSKVERKSYRMGVVPQLSELDLEVHRTLSFYVEASN